MEAIAPKLNFIPLDTGFVSAKVRNAICSCRILNFSDNNLFEATFFQTLSHILCNRVWEAYGPIAAGLVYTIGAPIAMIKAMGPVDATLKTGVPNEPSGESAHTRFSKLVTDTEDLNRFASGLSKKDVNERLTIIFNQFLALKIEVEKDNNSLPYDARELPRRFQDAYIATAATLKSKSFGIFRAIFGEYACVSEEAHKCIATSIKVYQTAPYCRPLPELKLPYVPPGPLPVKLCY